MTKNDYDAFEAAARLYCESTGIDPDEPGPNGIPWVRAAEDLYDLHIKMWVLRRCGHTVA